MKEIELGHQPPTVRRPEVPAVDTGQDALFAARAALGRAYSVRAANETQIDVLTMLIARLRRDGEGRTRP